MCESAIVHERAEADEGTVTRGASVSHLTRKHREKGASRQARERRTVVERANDIESTELCERADTNESPGTVSEPAG
jgi:hypothetical protein